MTWVEQDIEEDDKVDTGGENSRWVGEWEELMRRKGNTQ